MSMTVRMKKNAIIQFIRAAIDEPLDVMVMPARKSGNELLADGTPPPFSGPKLLEPGKVPVVRGCLTQVSFFEIKFPGRVIRIRSRLNLDVPLDG